MRLLKAVLLIGSLQGSLQLADASAKAASSAVTVSVDLGPHLNNRGFGNSPGDADFDGHGNAYPLAYAPTSPATHNGIPFELSINNESRNDNVLSAGQAITLPPGKYFSIHTLSAAANEDATGSLIVTYDDNSTSAAPIRVAQWSFPGRPTRGAYTFPFFFTNTSTEWNYTMLFVTENWVNSSKKAVSVQLPSAETSLHVFGIALISAQTAGPGMALDIQNARSTTKWLPDRDEKAQIVEVAVDNVGSEWVTRENWPVEVTVEGNELETVVPGFIKRLRPGDQARVQVGVMNKPGVSAGSTGTATVLLSSAGLNVSSFSFQATLGIPDYENTLDSVLTHESPTWFDNAKYGIFIHWGVYSVPGWGNVGSLEQYAEWYWYNMNLGPNQSDRTYEYHLATYGPNVVYDDFIQNFTASAYDPKEWVDLFDDAGANYFVSVSKHHDGYALYDLPANVSERTSVVLQPSRNLLKELFDAAAKYQPHLHRATYYSLSEWFHPDWKPYGWSKWPGGNATNPYTNQTLPYTGYVPVEDYLPDLMLPEMNALAELGTEIMWCDAGAANVSVEFMAAWFNAAAKENRQVTFNDRCGIPADFDTPEYARYSSSTPQKWESNLGMDPFSYGYNRATPLSAYMNASTIVASLIDIVSKNGNFLLDIGPMANGTIVPTEADNLREAGRWIKTHGEAIYNTTYWFVTPEEGDLRFTMTGDAFYILALTRPDGEVVIESPVPWVEGDDVVVVGGDMAGTVVRSRMQSGGKLVLDVPGAVADADTFAWVFKIAY